MYVGYGASAIRKSGLSSSGHTLDPLNFAHPTQPGHVVYYLGAHKYPAPAQSLK